MTDTPGSTTDNPAEQLEWIKVAVETDLPEGRVMTVTARTKSICLVHFDGQWTAMDNHCPHQGAPLGEGTIEKGKGGQCLIRCPWHGWDFDPLTGKPPGKGMKDHGQTMYPLDLREDGIYVGLEPEPPRERTVSDVMADTMVNWGVKSVFGMVGHSNLGLAEAIRHKEASGDVHYYGIRHEGAASFACSGYAKLSGKPAACLTIAGPGATNLMTGLWDAKVDRAPVLALTGQVQTQVFGPGAFQDIDLQSAFQAVARFSQPVLQTSNHAELMSLACKTALIERDIAHLIFPDDVQTVPSGKKKGRGPKGRVGREVVLPNEDDIADALAMIASAKRPAIVLGYGARDALDDVIALAEALNAPVMTTFKAKGMIPDDHPNAVGVLGRSGTPMASWFMNEADLLICLGSSFANHTGIATHMPIIQVDFDRMQLGKFHAVDLPIWGEIGAATRTFRDRLPDRPDGVDMRAEIADRWTVWREEKDRRLENSSTGLASAAVFKTLNDLIPADAVIAVDVGNNTYSFGRYFEPKGQSILMSGYLGSIGFSFPAAMGAWAATQDFEAHKGRQVISISGDGGFGQYAMEFTTAIKYNMNITHIMLNNSQLGKISKEQKSGEWPVWQTDLRNPSFATFARLCGGHGVKVTDITDLEAAVKEALAFNGPSLVEIITDADLI